MNAIYYGDTNIGNIRPKNEDAFVLKEVWGGTHLIAVCVDGVGGNGGGDVAANIVPIDYADLRTIKKIGAFKKAIIFDIDTFEEEWTDKFIENVKSLQLPLDSLRAFMMNYIACDEDLLLYSDIIKLWQYLTRIKYKDGETDNTFDSFIDCLWSVCVRHSMPKGTLKIQLLVSSEKTEQDKQDDEKYEQMIEEYRKPFFPPLDLPIIDLTPNEKE